MNKTNPHKLNLGEIVVKKPTGETIVYNEDMKQALKQTVAKQATDAELLMFAKVAAKYDLDPFAKEIWFIKYKGKNGVETRIETSRDGYLNIARRDPKFKGIQSFPVYEKDDFHVEIEGAEVKNVTHNFNGFNRGKLVGAWAVAEKEGQRPVYAVMPFEEYNTGESTWKSKPSAMIKKVAEADVLKRIGGISGLVTHEEMTGDAPVLPAMAEKKLGDAAATIPKDQEAAVDEVDVDVVDAEYEVKENDDSDDPVVEEVIEDVTPTPELDEDEIQKYSKQSGIIKALCNKLTKDKKQVTKENIITEAIDDERLHPDDVAKIRTILEG